MGAFTNLFCVMFIVGAIVVITPPATVTRLRFTSPSFSYHSSGLFSLVHRWSSEPRVHLNRRVFKNIARQIFAPEAAQELVERHTLVIEVANERPHAIPFEAALWRRKGLRCAKGTDYRPVAIHVPGGGWIKHVPSIRSGFSWIPKLADQWAKENPESPWVFLDLGYPVAPEHSQQSIRASLHQVFDYIFYMANELCVDYKRILLFGESAGGNLVAEMALWARDNNITLAHQYLVVPYTDYDAMDPELDALKSGYGLSDAGMRFYLEQYTNSSEVADWRRPEVAPLNARSLHGVAEATVLTAEFDPLRPSGAKYAQRLKREHVPTLYRMMEGAMHLTPVVQWQGIYRRLLFRAMKRVQVMPPMKPILPGTRNPQRE